MEFPAIRTNREEVSFDGRRSRTASLCQIVLRALDDAEQNLMTMRGSSGGSVKIGLVSTAKHIAPRMLTGLGQAAPPSLSV
jgi:hypothetical protein